MADPAWRLRSAGAADADALALVASATFLETYAGALDGADMVAHCLANNTREKFAAWASDPLSAVTLAEALPGYAPLGYTLLTSVDLPVEVREGDIELRRIYAMGRLHGTGAGPALMAQALADAARLGKSRVLLGVWGENHRAHRFYERQGFERIGTRQFKVGSVIHDDFVYARSV
ncbi:GNAT family N-acetyltransferase [Sphingomonas sp. MMS24-J45]|uniref:GNAT family N-acetyltransferase n=1 Tax=Sphingomonas sp. MMS24-J45 TaxID=3238806 RepID=UPI00384A491A